MYPDLPLRFIKIHGDILVTYPEQIINRSALLLFKLVIWHLASWHLKSQVPQL
jgi:hypothetical protein